jgi:hypothetical protein
MDPSFRPTARTQGIVVQEVPGELLVYDTESARAHCLNETAAAVWRAADGTRSVGEIAVGLGVVDATDPARGEALVWLALEQLEENGLMTSSLAEAVAGASRRELLRRVGLAAAVALPVVASLALPSSVEAGGGSCACVNPGECLTQTSCPSTANCNPSGLCAP